MADLKTNLQYILNEKNEKILPENIKKDIQIFDITGTYEGSGGGTVEGIKQFATEEEMQADTTAEEGDLAVVYRSEIQNLTETSVVSGLSFESTVVLDTAITSSGYAYLMDENQNSKTRCELRYSSSYFYIRDNYSGNYIVRYTSTDGITYTLNSGYGTSYTFEQPMYFSGTWNDVYGQFIQCGGMTFEGLYECKPYLDESIMKFVPLSAVRFDDTESIDSTVYPIWDGKTFIGDYVSLDKLQTIMQKLQDDGVLTVDKLFMYLFLNKNNEICTMISSGGSSKANMELHYNIDPSTKLVKDVVGISSAFDYTKSYGSATVYKLDLDNLTYTAIATVTEQSYTIDSETGYYRPYTDVNTCIIGVYLKDGVLGTDGAVGFRMKCINSSQTDFTAQNGIYSAVRITNDGTHAVTNNMHGDEVYPEKIKYFIASNQLTATADCVYKKEFYGKNGIETGTLQNKENLTKYEVKYRVDIWTSYSSGIVCPNDSSDMLKDCTNLTSIPLLDTSNVTNMQRIFSGCTNLTTIPQLNTSKVTNMTDMFYGCKNLTSIPLLDTSSATTMRRTFSGCNNLTAIPQLDTSSITIMRDTFNSCKKLTTIPLLDTSKVTNMSYMFSTCTNLITIPLLDTSKATDMTYMFNYCTNLTTVPQLDTSSATSINYMFANCISLTTIPQLNISKVTSMNYMFSGCKNLSDESLNNILAMCINATSYTGTKALKYIGITSEQATTCTTLSNYSAFTAAGWTTGY